MSWEYGFRIESSGRGLRPLGGEERIANRGTELFVLMLAEDRRLNEPYHEYRENEAPKRR